MIAAEDASVYRDVLGCALPPGLPAAFTESRADAARRARGPLRPHPRAVHHARRRGAASASPPSGSTTRCARSWTPTASCAASSAPTAPNASGATPAVLRRLRRRSLARLRHEVEPVDPEVLARFLPAWHGMDAPRHGTDALLDALTLLQGAPVPASTLEVDVLPARVGGYRPDLLDELLGSGEVVWAGAGAIGPRDGRIVLAFRDRARLLLPPPLERPDGPAPRRAARAPRRRRRVVLARPARRRPPTRPRPRCSRRCGTSCGPGTSPTTGSRRCARSSGRGRTAAPGRAAAPRPGGLRRIGPPAGAGRWSLVPTRSRRHHADRARPCARHPAPRTARRRHARGRARRGHRRRVRRGVPGAPCAGGVGQGPPRLLRRRARRRAVRAAGRGRPAARRIAPPMPTPSRASSPRPIPPSPTARALAWPESGPGRHRAAAAGRVRGARSTVRSCAYLERGGRTLTTFTDPSPTGPARSPRW